MDLDQKVQFDLTHQRTNFDLINHHEEDKDEDDIRQIQQIDNFLDQIVYEKYYSLEHNLKETIHLD